IILDSRKSIADLPFAGAQGFHLSAAQNDARLERLEDVIIAAGFRIAQDVGHEMKFEIRNSKFETISKLDSEPKLRCACFTVRFRISSLLRVSNFGLRTSDFPSA